MSITPSLYVAAATFLTADPAPPFQERTQLLSLTTQCYRAAFGGKRSSHVTLVSDPQTKSHVPFGIHPGKQGLKQSICRLELNESQEFTEARLRQPAQTHVPSTVPS